MSGNKKILVAAADVKDAGVVCQLLRREFDEVAVSTDPNKTVENFERCMPAVLLLAFTSLSKAQAYYQVLYRESAQADVHPHKVLILCSKTDLAEVYALCRKGHFSSYVLFWPLSYDAVRLQMEVHHALEQVAEMELRKPTISEFSAQIRRIAGLESLLELSLSKGEQHIEITRKTLEQAGDDIGLALEGFARRFSVGEHKKLLESCGPVGDSVLNLLASEITRLKTGAEVQRYENVSLGSYRSETANSLCINPLYAKHRTPIDMVPLLRILYALSDILSSDFTPRLSTVQPISAKNDRCIRCDDRGSQRGHETGFFIVHRRCPNASALMSHGVSRNDGGIRTFPGSKGARVC